jgi:flotillin
MEMTLGLLGGAVALAFLAIGFLVAVTLRRVVGTNEVHIVQSSKKTTSFGKDTGNGNTYFEWPASLPFLGVKVIKLQVDNFDINLEDYVAYDEGRLPFEVDVTAFFRIADANVAAQRISSFEQLKGQLKTIVEGAARKVLASNTIDEIMKGRSEFGEQFTAEVKGQLVNWGVETVKNIELMDIRDGQGSNVIQNIMDKKKSEIEMQSRIEVAKNHQAAQIAEIEAKRQTDLSSEEAKQQVGLRQVEVQRQLDMEGEKASQQVKEAAKTTKEKEMAVLEVEKVRNAEITKKTALILAEQNKQQAVIDAEASKQSTVLAAEADLETQKRSAEGALAQGNAKAESEKALLMAPVQAQVTLAKEIGQNDSYQKYLLSVEQIKANQSVGVAQAAALEKASIKVIANTGNDVGGAINGISDLFTSKGGQALGAMMEGLKNTEAGEALVEKFLPTPKAKSNGSSSLNGSAKS